MWNTWFLALMLTLTPGFANCTTVDDPPPSPNPQTAPAKPTPEQLAEAKHLADGIKFCTPNYVYGPDETPVIFNCPPLDLGCVDQADGDRFEGRCAKFL